MKIRFIAIYITIMFVASNIFVCNACAQDGAIVDDMFDESIQIVEEVDDDELLCGQMVHSGVWGTCKWEIDVDEGMLRVHPGVGKNIADQRQSPWKDYSSIITSVSFLEENGKKVQVSGSTAYLFADLIRADTIDLSGLDMQNVVDMRRMFENCATLTQLILSEFDTSNVRIMNCMFYGCMELTTVDVSNWDVSNVKDMGRMFCLCKKLKSIDVSGWDTSSVVSMCKMFMSCQHIEYINVSNWDTSSVEDMSSMFCLCHNLNNIDVSAWNTASVSKINNMFSGCEKLESLDMSYYDLSGVDSFEYMFRDCFHLKSANMQGINTTSVTNLCGMFERCICLQSIDLSGWNTSLVTDISRMFCSCTNLETAVFGGWDTSQIIILNSVFYNCSKLRILDVSSWTTKQIDDYDSMYTGCSSLDMFVVGKDYTVLGVEMFPVPTSIQERWWSSNEHKWFTFEEIVSNRSNIADAYYSYDVDQSGTSISGATVALDKEIYGWTGEEIKPSITVTLEDTVLRLGLDYTIAYKNNINTGTAKVILTGVGRYKDTISKNYVISYSGRFRDVNEKTYHVEDILWLAKEGISSGWQVRDDVFEFRPSKPVARADMASFLYRLARKWGLVDESWKATYGDMLRFRDVSSSTTSHYMAIWWLGSVGITKGWPVKDTVLWEFRPYASVTRQDMAAFLFRLAKIAGRGGASDTWSADAYSMRKFVDVDPKSETNHHTEVWWLAQSGVSEGWKVGNKYEFRGMQPVARQDMAAFLHRMDAL